MASDTLLAASSIPLEPTAAAPAKPPRYWPAVVMLAAYWGFAFSCRHLDLSMGTLFLSRVATLLLLLVAFSLWWLTNRRIPRGERWKTVAVTLCGAALAVPLTLTTLGPAVILIGLLFVFTAGTPWLLVSLWTTPDVRRWGLWTVIGLVWTFTTLLRFNGLSGDQEIDVHWRWTPTAEELFLDEHRRSAEIAPEERAVIELTPGDWPEFRGPGREGRIEEKGLSLDWTASPPQLAWKKRVGPGWSSVIVVGGRLYTQEQRGVVEAVVCYEAATGRELWSHEEAARFDESVSGVGPRATPTFAQSRIYAVGARGNLVCLDAATGRAIWSRDLVADSGATVPQWGYSGSPLVVENLVVAFAGGPEDNGLLAYRIDTGEPAWKTATGKISYSSPQLVSLHGKRQILFLSERALIAVEPSTGVVLWEYSLAGGPMMVPGIQSHRVGDNQLLVQTRDGLALLEVRHADSVWSVERRWASRALRPSFNDVIVYKNAIYGLDEGIFCCLDLQTGKRRWKSGRYGHGQVMLLANTAQLLVISEQGRTILLAADPTRSVEQGRFLALKDKTWNHPVIAHGRLYVRNGEEIACYDLSGER